MQKALVLKCAAVLVVAVLLGGYIVWDKQHALHAVAPSSTLLPYSSEDGVSFSYPSTYKLSSSHHSVSGFTWDSLELIDKNYIPTVNGEGPTAISMSVFKNTEGLTLEQWIKGDARSNYELSTDGTLTEGTIGGEPSLSYQYSGLYQNDAVAVLHKGKIFLFSSSWDQTVDTIRQDYGKVLSSVQFSK